MVSALLTYRLWLQDLHCFHDHLETLEVARFPTKRHFYYLQNLEQQIEPCLESAPLLPSLWLQVPPHFHEHPRGAYFRIHFQGSVKQGNSEYDWNQTSAFLGCPPWKEQDRLLDRPLPPDFCCHHFLRLLVSESLEAFPAVKSLVHFLHLL